MRPLLLLLLLLSLPAASQTASPTLQNDPTHPAAASDWVETQLYFGLGPADDPAKGTSEAQWRSFLDTEVTPRFPSGLSVLDVYGQWQSKPTATSDKPIRIRSKLLIILHPNTPENSARIDAIRTAWKQRTGDKSVLKVTTPAYVSF